MNSFSIESLLQSAGSDGSSVPAGPVGSGPDSQLLLEAWGIERAHSIECEILLALSRQVIARILANQPGQTVTNLQTTRELIRQIDNRLRNRPSDRS